MPLSPYTKTALRLAVSSMVLALTSQAHAISDAQFQPAFDQFLAANSGDSGAIDKAADAFDALLKAEPSNPVLMAYAGSSTARRAANALAPWKKMGYAEDGLAMIDKALAMLKPAHDAVLQHGTPGSLEVRFTAASTFLAVPSFMNRGARGAKLLGEVVNSPLLAQAPLPFQGNVWMRAAKLAAEEKRTDDARKYLNEVIQHNAPQAPAAKAQLASLS
jgi:hypothetical protein